jgi:hypothetical protein
MFKAIVGCLLPIIVTVDTLPEYQECRDILPKVEYVLKHTELVSRYFKEEDILKSLGIIFCESGGKPTAIGNNTNGTKDVGLWQFNDKTWDWLTPKLGIINSRKDPEVSTAVASWLVYNDGWHHWNSSKHCWKYTNNERLWIKYGDGDEQ